MLRVSVNALKISQALKLTASGLRNPAPIATLVGNNLSTKRTFSSEVPKSDDVVKAKTGLWNKYFGLESNIAREGFNNRWLMVVPAFFTHMSIGSTWAWSIMADVITRENGFVTSSFSDWTLLESAYPLSIVFLTLGVSASLVGKWQMKVGARQAIATAAAFFGGGCLAGAAGIHFHSLPLLYAGYGVMAGSGLGLAYTPPVQTLLQWFPDKKGVASGLTIAGFGSGALVFTPSVQYLMDKFHKLPEYLGPAQNFVTQVKDGRLLADVNGALVEVVSAGSTELAKIPYTLSEGLYVVGSGSTGATEALAVMGGAYFSVMMASALAFKKPHPTYVAPVAAVATNKAPVAPVNDITLEQAMRQPQFYLLGTTFTCLATGGMGMFSVAKPMMSEVFSNALPAIVTSAFAAKFILMLSAGNLGGRIIWAAVSDAIGRRNTFMIFTAGSIPLYYFLPTLVENVLATGSSVPLYTYCASTALAISMMGGVYAILPAYESDLFGTKFVGAVHGRMMLFSSIAALAGPTLLLNLRSISEKAAITDLLTKVSPENFQATFGAPMESAMELLATKTINISKLLALCPPGTLDPTPHLYDTTMYAMSGLTALAFVAHGLVRPLPQTPVPSAAGKVIDVPAAPVSDRVVEVKEAEVGDRQVNK